MNVTRSYNKCMLASSLPIASPSTIIPSIIRWLFPCVLLLLLLSSASRVYGLHGVPPTSIVYTGNGNTASVGYIVDVNNDQLLDFVVAYYQRDYNFASNVIFLNNGCEFVRHSSPFEPLVYCKQYFLNQIMIKWEADPPIVTLHIPNETFTGTIRLPYHPIEIPAIIFAMSGVKIGTPMEKFYKGDTQIQFHAIQKGDEIYVGEPGPRSASSSSSSSGGGGGSDSGSQDSGSGSSPSGSGGSGDASTGQSGNEGSGSSGSDSNNQGSVFGGTQQGGSGTPQ